MVRDAEFSPVLQVKVRAPLAASVVLSEAHITLEEEVIVNDGRELTLTKTMAVFAQPLASVPVTPKVGEFTGVKGTLFKTFSVKTKAFAPEAFKTTCSPKHNTVAEALTASYVKSFTVIVLLISFLQPLLPFTVIEHTEVTVELNAIGFAVDPVFHVNVGAEVLTNCEIVLPEHTELGPLKVKAGKLST
ncbi:hypothetical protein CNR22_24285 [Sphingobacteriaceae bacterium]|nr:hypothetical protein CNR22_24285 [Sphingobacteriaceae bacterium]